MDKNIMAPFFSIIIPTYNRAALIGRTIDSVLTQSYSNYEIIVVDDGSTDNTEEILQQYICNNFTYIKKQNGERAAARNYGTKLAKGNYINWFDSDDIMLPNHLDEAKKTIQQYNAPELFALPFKIQKATGEILSENHFPVPTANNALLDGNILACNPVFVRTDIALAFLFNEDRKLSGTEDYELWMRLSVRFPIYTGSNFTSALIEHDSRSMNGVSGNNMLQRYKLMMQYLMQDDFFKTKSAKETNQIEGSFCLLVALYFSLETNKKQTIQYSLQSFRKTPALFLSRRMLAVLKYLLFKW